MSESDHPLRSMFDAAARGAFPAPDGRIEVVPSPGAVDAIVGFTGHVVVAADVDPSAVEAALPDGPFSAMSSPSFLAWLERTTGARVVSHDVLLCADGTGPVPPPGLRRADTLDHPRVERAARLRAVDSVWVPADAPGDAVVVFGRGLVGRHEVGYEVAPAARGCGVGRRVVGAARALVPAGTALWAQVAPGNAASLRSTLAAGFRLIGSEILLRRDRYSPTHG